MTGTVVEKTMKSGTTYLYIRISYKDTRKKNWQQKWIPTGLPAKGNKKQAKALVPGDPRTICISGISGRRHQSGYPSGYSSG